MIKSALLLLFFFIYETGSGQSLKYLVKLFSSKNNELTATICRNGQQVGPPKNFQSADFYKTVKKSPTGLYIELSQDGYNRLFRSIQSDEYREMLLRLEHFRNSPPEKGPSILKKRVPGTLVYNPKNHRAPPKSGNKYGDITRLDLFVNLPADKEFQTLQKQLEDSENPNIYFANTSSAFLSGIHRFGATKPLVIVGSNKAGFLEFPDGSTIPLSDLKYPVPASNQYPIIYFNCNTSVQQKTPGSKPDLNFTDVLDIIEKLNEELNKPEKKEKEKNDQPAYSTSFDFIKKNYMISSSYKTFATGSGNFLVYEITR